MTQVMVRIANLASGWEIFSPILNKNAKMRYNKGQGIILAKLGEQDEGKAST